ncbi:hypothetical protein FM124_08550 [Pediococcus acidilactici]|nr:hypothetical protein FM124_08550 [Pediococcus acidilactici]
MWMGILSGKKCTILRKIVIILRTILIRHNNFLRVPMPSIF